jgi:hypothetical protein
MQTVLKAKCLRTEVTEQGSTATFVVLKDNQPEPQPGQRRIVNASNVTQITFQDDQAKNFIPGKAATITIEQGDEKPEE